jgi:predicted ATP-grasp superfamily ATP-dependent carboligase
MPAPHLLILGASARAAAFSALRSGYQPWCVDLFADVDLQQRCTITRLAERYPEGFQRFIEGEVPGPWLYAGGLENWPRLVERWAQHRPLWGNRETALSASRDPAHINALLRSQNMPVPALHDEGQRLPTSGRWLLKPRRSAGGIGIRFWTPRQGVLSRRDWYLQEFIEGEPLGLLYLGGGRTARLLGMTRQLVGETWLHAAPFRYCGSIGPLAASVVHRPALDELGHLLASECFLEGLFGVDGILRGGIFFPVEINPRYTASVEVLEHASGAALLGWHSHVFTHRCLPSLPSPVLAWERTIGKAILFARDDLHFPADGPWMTELRSPRPVQEMPAFADIPAAGDPIEKGKPILTFFAAADSASACEDTLRQIAADLDRWLFER